LEQARQGHYKLKTNSHVIISGHQTITEFFRQRYTHFTYILINKIYSELFKKLRKYDF
jgi:hypothetical protein